MVWISLFILLVAVVMGNGYDQQAYHQHSLEFITEKISNLEAKLDSLGNNLMNNCFEQNHKLSILFESKLSSLTSKIFDLENRMNTTNASTWSSSTMNSSEKLCHSSTFNVASSSSMIGTYFNRISFNVLQGKKVRASTTHSDEYIPQRSIDEDYATRYSSKEETNPWLLVDLGTTHLIFAIQMSLYQDTRTGPSGIKLYVTDDLTFDNNGVPDMKHNPVFGSIPKNPVNRYVQFTSPFWRCGRYVVVIREISRHYLTFWEISAAGFPLV